MLRASTLRIPGSGSARTVSGRRVPCPARRLAAAATARVSLRAPHLRASAASPSSDPLPAIDEPETAREAIELGNRYAKAARWQEALAVYERALSLPGTGVKRFRDKPRLISDGERSAALFNIACAQAQLGDTRSGLVALAGCLELGYDDFSQLRSDPDLEPLRGDERFEGLLRRFERPASSGALGGFLAGFFGGRK